MMYPFLTLDDTTEIVHSEMREDQTVKVYLEKPDEKDGFHHAECILPGYQWNDVFGFTEADIARYDEIIRSTAHLILQFSQEGGFDHAAGFKIGSYWVYFWSNENDPLEPIHVHVSQGAPTGNATKIWITSAGRCYLCNNNSQIPARTLRNIMMIIEARSSEVIQKWLSYFGSISYYC